MADNVLEVAAIETCYGLSQVLFGVSLSIAPGEMVTLMGRNGMGKTTTVRSILERAFRCPRWRTMPGSCGTTGSATWIRSCLSIAA